MLELMSFDKAQRKSHIQSLFNLEKIFPILVKGLLFQIQTMSAVTIFYPIETLHALESNYTETPEGIVALYKEIKQFVEREEEQLAYKTNSLTADYVTKQIQRHQALLESIVTLRATFNDNRSKMIGKDRKAYFEGHGYLLLLGSMISYNLAILKTQNQADITAYLNKCFDWMTIFETDCLPEIDYHFCLALRQPLVKKIQALKIPPLSVAINNNVYPSLYLSVEELRQLVNHKNKKAKHFGIPCQRFVIQQDSSTLCTIDLDTFGLLKKKIEKIINGKTNEPEHFLFYVNQEHAPVELLSVNFNKEKQLLEVVNISAGNDVSQYNFLLILSEFLEEKGIPYSLRACQANILPSEKCSQFYAYLLSGILAQISVDQLKLTKPMEQPTFYDCHERDFVTPKVLVKVEWFHLVHLGKLNDKALLLAPTHERRLALFKKVHGEKEGMHRYNFYSRKYHLVNNNYFDAFHHYYEYAYHQSQHFLASRLSSLPSRQIVSLTPMEIEHYILDDDYDMNVEHDLVQELENVRKKFSEIQLLTEAEKANLNPLPRLLPVPPLSPAMLLSLKQQSAKVLRRAAAGYCSLAEFEILLTDPSMREVIDVFDLNQQYNPLLQALSKQKPKRALMLLEAKANIKAANKEGNTAKEIYAELPADSPVKRNKKLKSYFVGSN